MQRGFIEIQIIIISQRSYFGIEFVVNLEHTLMGDFANKLVLDSKSSYYFVRVVVAAGSFRMDYFVIIVEKLIAYYS
jgi:hypothetical protein